MARLKNPLSFETTFGIYVVDELIGEGGAGRVYGGNGVDGSPIALKLLAAERSSTDKRKRFKNEIAFLVRNKHRNIVGVIDHGISPAGPFYVMRRYHSNLRELMETSAVRDNVMPLFSQILDGVEAAHLQRVVHRDLKPENILYDRDSNTLAVADFGTARFTEDQLIATAVETGPGQRLANFQYAAPEQRALGNRAEISADIYALGLILNEMFTGSVPHGTGYKTIGQVAVGQGFLDSIVAIMLRQTPEDRPRSIAEVKGLVQRYQAEAVSLQRLSEINGTVIRVGEIDEPLAEVPPKLIDADWDRGTLTLTLDRPVTPDWIRALHNMGSYSSVLGKPPQTFQFHGDKATVGSREHEIQMIIDNFKTWLPMASRTLKNTLQEASRREAAARAEHLRRERELEEQRLRVRQRIKI